MASITRPTIQMRPPLRKPYTPEKSNGAKPMTIAIGFQCRDGVVLCADRQFTSPGFYKYSQEKISQYFSRTGDFLFASSGSPNLSTEVQDKILERLELRENDDSLPELTGKDMHDIIDEVLTDMGRLNGVFSGVLQFLICAYPTWESPQLISFDGQAIHSVRESAVIGCGGDTSIVRFLCDKLYDPNLTCVSGARVGAYLIKKATQYVDGCGEPIDVMIMSGPNITKLEEAEVSRDLKLMEAQEQNLTILLVQNPFRT